MNTKTYEELNGETCRKLRVYYIQEAGVYRSVAPCWGFNTLMAGAATVWNAANEGLIWSTAAAGSLFQIWTLLGKNENLWASMDGGFKFVYFNGWLSLSDM